MRTDTQPPGGLTATDRLLLIPRICSLWNNAVMPLVRIAGQQVDSGLRNSSELPAEGIIPDGRSAASRLSAYRG